MKGAWGGWVTPNDWQGKPDISTMGCCVSNAAMQLLRIWRDTLQFDRRYNRLKVHLLLNRASPWADVHSHIPYRGFVEVRLKRDCKVALRIPEWAQPEDCRLQSGGKDATPAWEGRYAVVPGRKGEVVNLECPISERTEKVRISGTDYRFVLRGNDIEDVNPKGRHCPLFGRSHYRQAEARRQTEFPGTVALCHLPSTGRAVCCVVPGARHDCITVPDRLVALVVLLRLPCRIPCKRAAKRIFASG
jgi:hypothetical protein